MCGKNLRKYMININNNNNNNNNNMIKYFIGCLLFSLGATSFIFSNQGTDPLDVFCLGIQNYADLKIGTIQSLFAAACLFFYSMINKWKFPPISTFLTFFICGYAIDFFRYYLNDCKEIFNSYLLLFSGTLLCVEGSALIIMSGFGIRAMDLLSLSLQEKTNKPFWLFKGIFELMLLVAGWCLGGPVGFGTIVFLMVVGWLIQPVITLNNMMSNKLTN